MWVVPAVAAAAAAASVTAAAAVVAVVIVVAIVLLPQVSSVRTSTLKKVPSARVRQATRRNCLRTHHTRLSRLG